MSKVFNFGQGRRAGEIFGAQEKCVIKKCIIIIR